MDDWIPGELLGRVAVSFKPEESKFLVSRYPPVRAQACRNCGYISLSVVPASIRDVLKS